MTTVVYNTTDNGANDFDISLFAQTWRAVGAGNNLFIGTGNGLAAGFNLVIPATADATRNFTSAIFTATLADSTGTTVGKTLTLSAYADPDHAELEVGQARSGDTKVELGSLTIPTAVTTLDITVDPVLLNSLFRNSRYTTGVAVFILESSDIDGSSSIEIDATEGSGTPAFLTTVEHDHITGWLAHDSKRDMNTVDDRFGLPIASEDLVPDGFRPGLAVRPNDIDPPEVMDGYMPSGGEGTPHDEPTSG